MTTTSETQAGHLSGEDVEIGTARVKRGMAARTLWDDQLRTVCEGICESTGRNDRDRVERGAMK
jgi:hypothetical protein